MELKFKAAPHYRQSNSTKKIMLHLTAALLIVYAFALYRSFTLGQAYLVRAIVLMLVANVTAIVTESVWALCMHKNVVSFLTSSFPWVTAIILTLMVPVNTEPYALAIATFIAIFFGKLVFGGFGQNVFNPAAVGRAIIFASFAGSVSVDLITSATPATTLASIGQVASASDFAIFLNDFGGLGNLAFGMYQGAMGETFSIVILLLGVYLSFVKVIDWRIPVTYLGVLFFGSLLVGLTHGLGFEYALYAILTGGAVFGAVFMLTDPVTNPTTRAGKIVFAALAALITMVIRYFSNLPEGVLYSILFANILTPIIDKYFAGKQVDRIKKNTVSTFMVVGVSVILIFAMGFGLTPSTYTSISIPTFNHGKTVSLNADYSKYEAKLVDKVEQSYLISVKGYGTLSKDDGGAGGEEGYTLNEVVVTIDSTNNTVTHVGVVNFGDTPGIGDAATSEGFLYQFKGASLNSDVDVTSSATYTSESIIAALNYALNGCPSPMKISDDYSTYQASVTAGEDGVYHVSVLGFGMLPTSEGGAGGGDHYSNNEFDITITDGKVTSVVMTNFGDTAGIGDSVGEDYFAGFVGKSIDDDIDVVSGATYTSKSTIAAVKAALEASQEVAQ